MTSRGTYILHYFVRSRLDVWDFKAPVLVRAKLLLAPLGAACRLLSDDVPPLDNATLWSTSTESGSVPCFFSYSRRALCRSACFLS